MAMTIIYILHVYFFLLYQLYFITKCRMIFLKYFFIKQRTLKFKLLKGQNQKFLHKNYTNAIKLF